MYGGSKEQWRTLGQVAIFVLALAVFGVWKIAELVLWLVGLGG